MSTDNLVVVPSFQTCEYWQNGCLKAISKRIPVPILAKELYGERLAIQLHGGIEIHREPSKITQINLNGSSYVWHNPESVMKVLLSADCLCCPGSYMRRFPDGSYEARLNSLKYVWGPPCLGSITNRTHRKIDFIEVCGDLIRDIDLDYTSPHKSSCLCLECAESPVKPVFNHSQLCQCQRCGDENGLP